MSNAAGGISAPVAAIDWSNLVNFLYDAPSKPTPSSVAALLFTNTQFPYACNLFSMTLENAANQVITAPLKIGSFYASDIPLGSAIVAPTKYLPALPGGGGGFVASPIPDRLTFQASLPTLTSTYGAKVVYLLYANNNRIITNISAVYGIDNSQNPPVFYSFSGCVYGKANNVALPPAPPLVGPTSITTLSDVSDYLGTLQSGYGAAAVFTSGTAKNPCDFATIAAFVGPSGLPPPGPSNAPPSYPLNFLSVVTHTMSGQPINATTFANGQPVTTKTYPTAAALLPDLPALARGSAYVYLMSTDNLGNPLKTLPYTLNPDGTLTPLVCPPPSSAPPPSTPPPVSTPVPPVPTSKGRLSWGVIIAIIIAVIVVLFLLGLGLFLLLR